MDVAVVSCLYGDSGYDRFIQEWMAGIGALNSPPAEIIIAADREYEIPGARVIVSECSWQHPQPYYVEQAFHATSSEWVWQLDIDDTALPDALAGIDDVTADVWQMGYLRSDGLRHIPPQLTAEEYSSLDGNPFVRSSAIRAEAFQRCGGYPDIAFEDWGLWRRMAYIGVRFESSGRPHFRYRIGRYTRSSTELVASERARHVAEMHRSEEEWRQ